MSDDWQPGDQALCIKSEPWETYDGDGVPDRDPECGKVYAVKEVLACHLEGHVLGLKGFEPFYASRRFVKIRPHTPDAEDIETIKLLNGDKQPCKTLT